MGKTTAQAIAKEVAKLLLPRMKKIVEESVERKMKDLVYDSVVGHKKKLSEDVFEDDWEEKKGSNGHKREDDKNISEAKKKIAERGKSKARELGSKLFSEDEMDLIMDTDIPDQNPAFVSEEIMQNVGSVKASELNKNDNVAPEAIDYSEMVADL